MQNSKWFVTRVRRLVPLLSTPYYDAVKVTNGVYRESGMNATSYVAACKRADMLNRQDELRKVRVK